MKQLLTPAINLMEKLQFPQKFGLLFTIIMIPLITLAFFHVSVVNDKITFLENESRGLEYIKIIRLPLEVIQQHRGMTSAYLNGAREFEGRIIEKRRDVDKRIIELEAIDKRFGSSFNTDGLINDIKSKWEHIKSDSFEQTAIESINEHNLLNESLISLMKYIADKSELSLDPVMDSYYLGAAVVSDLPALSENMGKTRALASAVAAAGYFSSEKFTKLSIYESNIQGSSENLKEGLQSVAIYNPILAENLKEYMVSNDVAIEKMMNLIRNDLLGAESINVDANTVFNISTDAISQSYILFDAIVPELRGVFEQRIADETFDKYVTLSIVMVVLVLIFYLFTALYYSIQNSIRTVGNSIKHLANGELFTRLQLNTKDEMGMIALDFNDMAEKFEALVQQIVSATSQLAITAEEYAQISRESSSNLEAQNRETEQVATAMNEMSATVSEVAKSASDAANSASNADNEAANGKTIVHETTQSIVGLATEVENVANVIQTLAKESEDIGGVLDVIKGIAEQTNLLALNAAIEAARAGEQGRGFAVVADEVRTLASRTQDSTKEIESMIEHLQVGANNAVSVMDTGRKKAQVGVEHSNKAATALDSITDAVAIINQMNTQIASAAEEQSVTAEEMNRNIVSISHLTEKTLSGASKSTSASEELAGLATHLKTLVSQFKMTA